MLLIQCFASFTQLIVASICRMRPKKKKKKEFGGVSSLSNVTHSGNLYQKGMFSWTQRYCAISDRQLVCYRNDRDSKPLLCVPLHGRDVMYSSRADCRFTHALRLSRPGCETHWFFADTKDSADLWLAVSYKCNLCFMS